MYFYTICMLHFTDIYHMRDAFIFCMSGGTCNFYSIFCCFCKQTKIIYIWAWFWYLYISLSHDLTFFFLPKFSAACGKEFVFKFWAVLLLFFKILFSFSLVRCVFLFFSLSPYFILLLLVGCLLPLILQRGSDELMATPNGTTTTNVVLGSQDAGSPNSNDHDAKKVTKYKNQRKREKTDPNYPFPLVNRELGSYPSPSYPLPP